MTDHATRSVTIGRIYVRSTAMRPNNNFYILNAVRCPYVTYVCNAGRDANDVIMRIAGLVGDDTGRRYGDWRHVATGCNALVIIIMTMYMALLSWRGHGLGSTGSFDECRLSARWPPTLKPSQPTWPVSPPVGCYRPHLPSPFVSVTQVESW